MRALIVYAGPNGSGKSSLRDILPDPSEVIIGPDWLARQINPVMPRSADYQAGRLAIRLFQLALTQGQSISPRSTLTGRVVLERPQGG